MTFCPDCGRARTTSTRYCGGCGRDFGVALPPSAAPRPTRPSSAPADRPPGSRRMWWIAAAVVVVLAAGGGAYALVHGTGDGRAALPQTHPSTATTSATQPVTQPASLQASTSPSAIAPTSPSASPSPTVSPSVVSIAPGVRSASAPVEIVLSHYFQGINQRDYAEYASSQTAQGKQNQPQSSFDSGYATTTDSGMRLTGLTATGQGDLTATVTFTSRQSPTDSVDNNPCNAWTLNLYLVPNGTGYLITPAPPGYEPSYTDC